MYWSITLLLLAGMEGMETGKLTHFENYSQGYRAAEKKQRPMLVIFNPGSEDRERPITLEGLCRDEQRQRLLNDYIVVFIDTGTGHGQTVGELFGSENLPRVVVIDKRQKFQIYRSSAPPDDQQWAELLMAYRSGQRPASQGVEQTCST